jgi:anti-sigma regulatory factor (Ser/Thr protein kinase)
VPSELTLEPVASAPQTARRWVEQELAERHRADLADSAVLGVSELVTNAVLHVRSSIVVRLVDVDARIRIEVYDHAPRPAEGHQVVQPGGRDNESTIGRGLQIVDSISHAWGVSYEHLGKCVWFNPASDTSTQYAMLGASVAPTTDGLGAGQDVDGSDVTVRLVELPVRLVSHYRTKFFDLRRELTLIALGSDHTDTVAHRLIQLAERMETLRAEQGLWTTQIERAARAGLDRATIVFEVPRYMLSEIQEFQRLLDDADEFARDAQLLTLAAGDQERELRAWYLGEIIAQLQGNSPIPWHGGFDIDDAS